MKQPDVSELESVIGYHFKDRRLLEEALTHSSYSAEYAQHHPGQDGERDYERLEFLGDAVLELCTSEYLMRNYDLDEGQMTRIRASIVCEASLSRIAGDLGYQQYLRLGNGEEKNGGRNRPSILCDLFESVLGAVYMDAGFEKARAIAWKLLFDEYHLSEEFIQSSTDYKTNLQEKLQARGLPVPEYRIVKEEGPTNHRVFTVELYVKGKYMGRGTGLSKKAAGQEAARAALENGKLWN